MHFRGLGKTSSKVCVGANELFESEWPATRRRPSTSLCRSPFRISTIGTRVGNSGSAGSCWWDALESGNYSALLASLTSFSPDGNVSSSAHTMSSVLRDPGQEAEVIHRVAAGLVAAVIADPSYCPPWVTSRLSSSTRSAFSPVPSSSSSHLPSRMMGWQREGEARRAGRRRGRSHSPREAAGATKSAPLSSGDKSRGRKDQAPSLKEETRGEAEGVRNEKGSSTPSDATRESFVLTYSSDRSLAFSVLSSMSDALLLSLPAPSASAAMMTGDTNSGSSSSQTLARSPSVTSILVTLCALCVAENDNEAVALATMVMPHFPEGVGCALIAYCYTAVEQKQMEATIETHWWSLWRRLRGEEHMNESCLHHRCTLSSRLEDLHVQAVQSHLLAWQVHCVLTAADGDTPLSFYLDRAARHTAMLPQQSSVDASSDSTSRTSRTLSTVLQSMPSFATAEWVSYFPDTLETVWSCSSITTQAFYWACSQMISSAAETFSAESRAQKGSYRRLEGGVGAGNSLSFAVSVHPASISAKVQGTLLRYLMLVEAKAALSSAEVYIGMLWKLTSLWGVQNPYAIAASLLPSHSSDPSELQQVMIGQRCEVRARTLADLAESTAMAMRWLCTGGVQEDVTPTAAAAAISRTESIFPTTLLQHTIENHKNAIQPVPHSWRWERRLDVERAVSAGTDTLVKLLSLCSNREGSLPSRKAVPAWRLKLLARAPVRSHKYELLLSEIPHETFSTLLSMLLDYGFIAEVSELAVCLIHHGFIDIRAYSSSLMGSLKLAIQSVSDEKVLLPSRQQRYQEALARLTEMYRQRRTMLECDDEEGDGIHHSMTVGGGYVGASRSGWRAFPRVTTADAEPTPTPVSQPTPLSSTTSPGSWSTVSSRVAVMATLMKEREISVPEDEQRLFKCRSGSTSSMSAFPVVKGFQKH